MPIKTTSPNEGNLRAERAVNSGTQFFCLLRLLMSSDVHHGEETWTL